MNSAQTQFTRVSSMKSMEKTQKILTIKQVASSARKEIKGRRIDDKTEKIHIPNDICEEIMVRLPVNSLMRFQHVSKHWRSLIRSKDFGERHMALENSKECKSLIFCNRYHDCREKIAPFLKTMALGTTSASMVDKTALEVEESYMTLIISESCDGLVCIYGSRRAVKVINPATKMFIKLPLSRIQQICIHSADHPYAELEPNDQEPNHVRYPGLSFSQFGFGKDSFTGRYKLVWLYNTYPFTTTTCEVLDLEEKAWRFVDTAALDHHNILNSVDQNPGVFVNGSLYWCTGDEYGDPLSNSTKLIVFDIHTEMFQVIPLPPCITDIDGTKIGICNLHGHLCISEKKEDDSQEFWWRVKDNTWEKIFSVHLPSIWTLYSRIDYTKLLTPLAIFKDTNKVILSFPGEDNLVAIDLDPHSTDYQLYYAGYYGLAVPYFPSLSLFHSIGNRPLKSSYVD